MCAFAAKEYNEDTDMHFLAAAHEVVQHSVIKIIVPFRQVLNKISYSHDGEKQRFFAVYVQSEIAVEHWFRFAFLRFLGKT